MSQAYVILPIIAAIVAFEAGAQYCVKRSKSDEAGSGVYFLLAVMLYALVCGCLSKCYDHQQMGSVNAVWSSASIIAIILVGVLAYHETITAKDILGICLMVVGIFFVFVQDHQATAERDVVLKTHSAT